MASERIQFLDLLRGVALCGILLMNVQSFGGVAALYLNPAARGPVEGADLVVWAIVRLIADQKFLGLFAMLFGGGVLLYTDPGEHTLRLHRRRMAWLAVFGLLHATLIWHGDVLFCYGVCGLIVVGARRWTPRRLFTTAALVAAGGSALWVAGGVSLPWWPAEMVDKLNSAAWMPPEAEQAAEIAAYRGGWLAQMEFRLPQALDNELGGLFFMMGWKAASLMLLGMGLYRLEILTGRASRAVYRRLAAWGLGVGLTLNLIGVVADWKAGWSVGFSFFFGGQINYWASYGVALGWLALVALAQGRWPAMEARLAAVGRMAFSNYILHSVLGTSVFYGLGLFGRLDRLGQLGVVAIFWAISLTLSPWWLHRFRQGPLEWAWRGLVRGGFERLRR